MANIPTVYIIGADKGGVGKTTITTLLLDYFAANGVEFKAYDTEAPSGALKHRFPERTTVVDLSTSIDQEHVFDNLSTSHVTVIDIRAGLLSPTLKLLADVGFFEAAKANKLKIVVLHVLGPSTQSLSEVGPIVGALQNARHVVLANHIDDTAYTAPAGAIEVPYVEGRAMQLADAANMSFGACVRSDKSFVLRGKLSHWMGVVFASFDANKIIER